MPIVTLSEFLFISQKDVGPILIRFWDYSNPKVHCILTFVPITNGPSLSLAQNLVSNHFNSVTSSFQCLISKAVKLSNFGQKNDNKKFKCSRLFEGDGIEFRILFLISSLLPKILKIWLTWDKFSKSIFELQSLKFCPLCEHLWYFLG